MKSDTIKNKIVVILLSFTLVGIVTVLFFIDTSLQWGLEKILSCVFIYDFLRLGTMKKSHKFILNEDKTLKEWFQCGFEFGASGIAFPILFAPYFGTKYYFAK